MRYTMGITVYPCYGHFWQRGNDCKPVDAGTYSILRAESFCGWFSGIWRVEFHHHLVGTRASTFLSCHLSSSWAWLFSFGSCFLPTTMLAAFSDPAVCIFFEKKGETCTEGFAKSKAKESCTCSYGSTRVANCIDGPQCKVTGGYQTDMHSALYMAAQLQKGQAG